MRITHIQQSGSLSSAEEITPYLQIAQEAHVHKPSKLERLPTNNVDFGLTQRSLNAVVPISFGFKKVDLDKEYSPVTLKLNGTLEDLNLTADRVSHSSINL
ncbi:hypothetical protein PoB_000456000 [Plakobranchus ocellatus]|uniref:Uncharacterized protein n=1 Tax=Plakobranchus ocellatus TaxID=259542 RepID=A0AAV3Y6E0_9GAST|nr:hypothetical protein PoB_000456000 [Plakobranchus ocellatus]